MNLTITPLNTSNNPYRYKNNQPVFKANPAEVFDAAEEMAAQIGTKKSGFFKPIEDWYDRFTDYIAEKFTSKYIESKPIMYLAEKFKDSKNSYQHCLTVGSVITSGLYMERTYTNKKLEKDRRNTLVVNQGLTLALSTAGAYLLDKYLSGWWDNVTARFAGHLLGDKDFYDGYLAKKQAIKEENKAIIAKDGKNAELKSIDSVSDLVKKTELYKNLASSDKDAAKVLIKKLKGIGLLKTMIVFGFVYRYFVPVVVTKPANKLCDMYLERKRANKEA